MVRFITLLAFSGISTAKLTGFHAYKRDYKDDKPILAGDTLNISDTCPSNLICDKEYCMQQAGTCCGHGDGMYCVTGTYCSGIGCCDDNTVCSDKVEGCQTGYETCGSQSCMPSGAVCCNDGSYCSNGDVCASDGSCTPGDGSSNSSASAPAPSGATVTSAAAIPTAVSPTLVVSDSIDTYTELVEDTSASPEATYANGEDDGGDTILGSEPTATGDINGLGDASTTAEPTFETVTAGDGSSGDATSAPEASSTEKASGDSAGSIVTPSLFGAILAAIAAL